MQQIELGTQWAPPRVAKTETARRLGEEQLLTFDTEHICDKEWKVVRPVFDAAVANKKDFTFLDIGGGNGAFADQLLEMYPNARGTVLDPAEVLLARSRPHPRKEHKLAGAEDIDQIFGEQKFDLILFNWILHHLVTGSYHRTTTLQYNVLKKSRQLLKPGGAISVLENLYDGRVIDTLPSRLVFALTSSRLLAPWVRRLGANTAGCGVCFRSRDAWTQEAERAGLTVEKFIELTPKPIGMLKETLLHVGFVGHGLFWMRPTTG